VRSMPLAAPARPGHRAANEGRRGARDLGIQKPPSAASSRVLGPLSSCAIGGTIHSDGKDDLVSAT
jgi:hypothetical protein